VRHHLKHNLWRPESLILFVGYQSEGTLGRILIDGASSVKLFDEKIQVRAEISVLPGVSGHADRSGLLRWLGGFEEKPKLVFVNHGDPDSADAFAATLEGMGYRAMAPYSGTTFDLLSGSFTRVPEPRPIEKKSGASKANAVFSRLITACERLLRAAKKLEGHANKELASFADQVTKLAEKMEK
jgi:metallo-beta-lactamase family protein